MKGSKKRVSPNAKKVIPEKERITRKIMRMLEKPLNRRYDLLVIEESLDVVGKIIKSIKTALVLGSIAAFLWTLKGPEDLPGSDVDKSPWIKNKHSEYKNKENKEIKELVYVPILRREVEDVTAYVLEDPRQTDSDPGNASCGRYDYLVKKGINIIAVSQDIFFDKEAKSMLKREKPLCGLPVVIKLENGEEVKGIIMDTMNPRFEKRADLGISAYRYGGNIDKANKEALKFGKKEAKDIIVFLPINKEALSEGIVRELVKERLKRLIESSLVKRYDLLKKSQGES